jgi:hypothetical protein
VKSALIRFAALGGMTGACLALVATVAAADLPRNLSDIPYQGTDWGGDQLRMRGYTLIDTDWHDGKTVEYWWQGSSNTCVQARAADGRYEALKTTSNTDCNQYHAAASKNNEAAALAVGAAALIGVAALAHKSHERNEKHGHDSKSVAEFDRGYRDGLYHQPYHNYQNTNAYSDGYNSGHREREEQTRYRPRHGGYSGYQSYVYVDDLVGSRGSTADSELRSRGFRDTGGYKQGGKSFVTWYNRGTRQCVQTVTRDGSVKRIDSIHEGNCL